MSQNVSECLKLSQNVSFRMSKNISKFPNMSHVPIKYLSQKIWLIYKSVIWNRYSKYFIVILVWMHFCNIHVLHNWSDLNVNPLFHRFHNLKVRFALVQISEYLNRIRGKKVAETMGRFQTRSKNFLNGRKLSFWTGNFMQVGRARQKLFRSKTWKWTFHFFICWDLR